MSEPNEPKIYLLPNLMTAGNLFCGFAAVLRIIDGSLLVASGQPAGSLYYESIAFILGACVFDLLDGRLARLGGHESAFGREFDSLADIVSFGVAPALLVYQIVLRDFQRTGWLIAFFFPALRGAPPGALQLHVASLRGASGQGFSGVSNPCSRRAHRLPDPPHALASGG